MDLLDQQFLFASLIWGSVGVGYWIYGKRQSSWPAMIGGVAMTAASYLIPSAVVMSLVGIAIGVAVYQLIQRGY